MKGWALALHEKLYRLPGFQRHYAALLEASVRGQFTALNDNGQGSLLTLGFNIDRLMTCASVLAQSDAGEVQDAALRIAQYAFSAEGQNKELTAAAAVVLDTLANRPAIDLAIQSYGLGRGFEAMLPTPLRLDRARRQLTAELPLPNGARVYLNKFQQRVRDAFAENDVLSVSAPTSAGKSFVLQRLVVAGLSTGGIQRVAYVVPTRALIHQIEQDLKKALGLAGLSSVSVHGVPTLPKEWQTTPFVLVFTQERLQWLLRDAPEDFSLDLVIADEAQKIGEGARGILLEQALADALARDASCKFVFCSPLSQNPDLLLQFGGPNRRAAALVSDYSAVNQNLLWATQVERKPEEWNLEHITGDTDKVIGRFKLQHRPSPPSKRLPLVAHALGHKTGNIIYVNGAADAEDVAAVLQGVLAKEPEHSKEREELAQLAASLVHQKYALVQCVRKGVAFHYGNMPALLRYEIERLFKEGKLSYLVCTSTLLEGVNLAAKAMFLRGPTRGIGQPMNEFDFWNLAGRAGRLGQDFQGNIVCVDARTSAWREPPPSKRRRYYLRSAFRNMLVDRLDDLVKYIDDGAPVADAKTSGDLDYGVGYLVSLVTRHGSLSESPVRDLISAEAVALLEERLAKAIKEASLPNELLDRHPGINPFAIRRLYHYFNTHIDNVERITPPKPESDDAVDGYKRIIEIINSTMTGDSNAFAVKGALLAVHWMRGWTLARMIADAWKYEKKQTDSRKNLASVIRETMDLVENFVRFKFLKYVSCYVDVLRHRVSQMPDGLARSADLPSVALWLEFGASTDTQLALMGLGLSRTTAIELSRLIANDAMTEDEVHQWLTATEIEGLNLAPALQREILRTINPGANDSGAT